MKITFLIGKLLIQVLWVVLDTFGEGEMNSEFRHSSFFRSHVM